MDTAAHVEVLLATYNGERFLSQQIGSILAQDYPNLSILASDDGSRDATHGILADYTSRFPTRVRVLAGLPPTGSARNNFLQLMQHSSSPYVCFSDQDDVWLASKVSRSMQAMHELEQRHGTGAPLLVFTDLRVVDQDLQTIHASMWDYAGINPRAALRLERLLGQAVVTGCTITINQPLLELARQMPPEATMHDRWLALLAASMGASTFLREPQVLYRQHDCNVIGAVTQDLSVGGILRRVCNHEGREKRLRTDELQIEALQRLHGSQMTPANAALLSKFLLSSRSPNPFKRIWLTVRHGFLRQGLLANLALLLEPFRSRRSL